MSTKVGEDFLKIAVDGPSGAGKGTIARHLAKVFSLKYLDTGLLYRALAWLAQENNIKENDLKGLEALSDSIDDIILKNPLLRHESVANMASKIAVIPLVRQILTDKMCLFVKTIEKPLYKGVVLDGRDIGTVVLTDADIKFFITANEEVRVNRRAIEMEKNFNEHASSQEIMKRDDRDSKRSDSPLQITEDAILVDTSNMSISEAQSYCEKKVNDFLQKIN